jgi:hypothetical protein
MAAEIRPSHEASLKRRTAVWGFLDQLGLMQQIRALPAPSQAG